MEQITPRELEALLGKTDSIPLLLDVREPAEHAICKFEGSLLVPMQQIPLALDEFDRNRWLVVICHHGIRSFQVAQYLEHQGFEKVMNLLGGIDAWAAEVDPLMQRY